LTVALSRLLLLLLVAGTGELPSALRKCLEKQAKTLMVAHGLAVPRPLGCPCASPRTPR
jgi:hypothetical protein